MALGGMAGLGGRAGLDGRISPEFFRGLGSSKPPATPEVTRPSVAQTPQTPLRSVKHVAPSENSSFYKGESLYNLNGISCTVLSNEENQLLLQFKYPSSGMKC